MKSRRSQTSSPTTCRRCRRTGTGASSSTARRSRPATSSSWPRSSATSPSARWKRASPPVRSRCTPGRRRSSPRSSCTRSTRTRTVPRNTSTASSRSGSPPLRPPEKSHRSGPAVTAVIAAAGSGERLGAGGPKAFVQVAGRPMIEWSIDAFGACESVHSIVVAAPPGYVGELAGHDLGVVPGGTTRAQSVANALEAVGTGYVAIHDAARPLLTTELVEALVADLDANEDAAGVIAAALVTDTIKRAVDANQQLTTSEGENRKLVIEATEDRRRLWRAQTPQVFRTDALREAL